MSTLKKIAVILVIIITPVLLKLLVSYDTSILLILPSIAIGGIIILSSIDYLKWLKEPIPLEEKWWKIGAGYYLPMGLMFINFGLIYYLYILKKENFDGYQFLIINIVIGVSSAIGICGQMVHLIGSIYSRFVKFNFITFLFLFFVFYITCGAGFALLYLTDMNGIVYKNSENLIADTVYFSFVTLSTTGFGDIFPKSNYAKFLVVVENMVGLFLTAYVVAMIFSSQKSNKN